MLLPCVLAYLQQMYDSLLVVYFVPFSSDSTSLPFSCSCSWSSFPCSSPPINLLDIYSLLYVRQGRPQAQEPQ